MFDARGFRLDLIGRLNWIGFAALVFLLLLVQCSESSQEAPPDDGDIDNSSDGDQADDIDPRLQVCYNFCNRIHECDESGQYSSSDLSDCMDLCPGIDNTCIGQSMLPCVNEIRCSEFNTCVRIAEIDADCPMPSDGDYDEESEANDAPRPRIVAPDEINFGAVVINQSASKELEISNKGSIYLEIYDILVGNSLSEFEIEYQNGTTLYIKPKDSLKINLSYSPTDPGRDFETLLIYSNAPGSRVTKVQLVSDYKGFANIEVDPQSLDFGTIGVGDSSEALRIQISNTPGSPADNKLLTILGLDIAGTAEGAYDFASSSLKPPFYIAPYQTQSVELIFAPQTDGEVGDTLTITSDSNEDDDKVIGIDLNGNGAAKRLCILPDPIQFGSVKVGEVAQRQVELEACGSSSVILMDIKIDNQGGPFSLHGLPVIGEGGLEIGIGERERFTVQFAPESTFSRSASILVESNDLFLPNQEVPVNGQGAVSNLAISPSFLAFGDIAINTTKDLPLTLHNTGIWPLEITDGSFDLADSPFDLILPVGTTFPIILEGGGGEIELSVAFSPILEESFFDNLTFESDNSSGEITVGLSGRGTAATIHLSDEGPISFNNVLVGTKKDVVLTVSNAGLAPLTISKYGFDPDRVETDFSFSPPSSSTTLPALASIEITLTFEPQSVKEEEILFNITSDDTNQPDEEKFVTLRGSSIDPVLNVEPVSPMDFGQVFVGASKGPWPLTLSNTGVGELVIFDEPELDINPENAFIFIRNLENPPEFPMVLRPFDETGDKLTLLIAFAPAGAGNLEGQLTIESNDIDRTPYHYMLNGSGAFCPEGFYDCDDNPADCEYACNGTPEAEELCNALDDNCNCETDEGFDTGNLCVGEGVCPSGVTECDPVNVGQIICSTNPGGSEYPSPAPEEICNHLDDDCNELTDETFHVDEQCVGEGECGAGTIECRNVFDTRCSTDRGGSEDQSTDEICDLKDNDCDGLTDEDFGVELDCAGEGQCLAGVWECEDPDNDQNDNTICSTLPGGSQYPDPAPVEICDYLDNDCNGETDETWEIYSICEGEGECATGYWECETTSTRRCSVDPGGSQYPSPAPQELCDNRDNDCDTLTDEIYEIDETCPGVGECPDGLWECASILVRRCSTNPSGSEYPFPAPLELCDGFDNDCDGPVDEIFGIDIPCDGLGECGPGLIECADQHTVQCSTDQGGTDHDDPVVGGTDEICDGKDNDCDGHDDEDFGLLGTICNGEGECGYGTVECDPIDRSQTLCSTEPNGSTPEFVEETCNGLDDDCDGIRDEICRSNVFRSTREVTAGSDYDHRLSPNEQPPDGFDPDPAEALFALYSEECMETDCPTTMPFVELVHNETSNTIYTYNTIEITNLINAGWTESGEIGRIATSAADTTSTQLYRLSNPDNTSHYYTTDFDEVQQLASQGYQLEDVAGWVWPSFAD